MWWDSEADPSGMYVGCGVVVRQIHLVCVRCGGIVRQTHVECVRCGRIVRQTHVECVLDMVG